MTPEKRAAIKAAVSAAMPAGWRWKLTATEAGHVSVVITQAPVDLIAVDEVAYPGSERPTYVKVTPLAYETPWCDASRAIGAIWRALLSQNTVEFDAEGDRAGAWYVAELWIGTWRRPFVVSE